MSMGNYFLVPLFLERDTGNDRYREILGLAA